MTTYDFAAIGLGPFNLGLACLTEPIDELDGVFLEAGNVFDWHPGMMLQDASLQVPFMADLVTMADPTSRFSFLAYLKQAGRLYSFYIREDFYPLRTEYNHYCRWVVEQLDNIGFGRHVERIEHDGEAYVVHSRLGSGDRETVRARRLVLGTGTQPHVPDVVRDLDGPATHTADYLANKSSLQAKQSITIVGSGQSAAEVYLDLLEEIDTFGYTLNWVTRSPRFFPMEYAKLTLEMTSPEYTAYFHSLPEATRERLVVEHKPLYKGISGDFIDAIFDTLYRKRVHGEFTSNLLTNTELVSASWDQEGGRYALGLFHSEQGEAFGLQTEGLVLATGYRSHVPGFLAPIADRIRWDDKGRYGVAPGYTIDHGDQEIFVQNAEEHTHGFVTPDLGMGAFRNSAIIAAMCGREVYPIEDRIAFQTFGVPVEDRPAGLGEFGLEPLDVERDAALLHGWVTHPESAFWGMQGATADDVQEAYAAIAADPHHDAWLGLVDGEPAFLAETYDPAHSELAGHCDVRTGDAGMHLLVAPTDRPLPGFTAEVMRTVMAFCFADRLHDRVVVEPDVRNDKIAVLNAAAGFVVDREIQLSDKRAALSTCTRAQFEESVLGGHR